MLRSGILATCLLLGSGAALADAHLTVCFNYGCLNEASVVFSEAQIGVLAGRLRLATSALAERAVLAQVMGQLYRWAGEQSPIHVDRPGDYLDDDVPGKMDCIDHAQTTTRMLLMLERRGLLRFHEVDEVHRRVRWLVAQHFSAVIREKNDEAPEAGARFVVDTWFGEHGDPAVVLPLEDWLDGEGPNVS
ncbi:hypothetical protein [Zoogloea sp.]|uniref:hypothetical protein n=1 Tax=Zoogloea sp. TaxID=49181 RepID=UPI0035B34CFD